MLKNFFSYGFVEGFAKGLNKLTLLLLPLFISSISYGKIGILVSLEVLIPLFSFLGLERAILRFYNEKDKYPSFIGTIIFPIRIIHVFLIFIFLVLYFCGIDSFFGISIFPDVLLILFLVYLQGMNNIVLNVLRVEENHKKYFKGRLVIQLLKFVLTIGLVVLFRNYIYYVVGAIIASFISNLFFFQYLKNQSESTNIFNRSTFNELFKFSWPFIFHGIATNLLGNADKFIIERLLDMDKVGQYTFAYSLGTTIVFVFLGVTIFIEPLVYKEKDVINRTKILNKFIVYTQIIAVMFYILVILISIYVLPRIYYNSFKESYRLIPLISLAHMFFCFYLAANYKLVYKKKSKQIAIISIFSCIVNILLNILMIPKFGIFGSVLVTFISFFIQAMLFELFSEDFKITNNFYFIVFLGLIISIIIGFKLSFIVSILLLIIYLVLFIFSKRYKDAI